ncbi:MAG: hypothetical protein ACOCQD_03335 [archaeon]
MKKKRHAKVYNAKMKPRYGMTQGEKTSVITGVLSASYLVWALYSGSIPGVAIGGSILVISLFYLVNSLALSYASRRRKIRR